MKQKIQSILALLALGTSFSSAAVIADFSFSEYSGAAPTPNATFTNLDASDPSLISASITTTGLATGGSGSYDNELNLADWGPGSMSLTLDFGSNTVDLTDIVLNIARNGAAAPTGLRISFAGTDSDIGGIATRNGSLGPMPATGFEQTFDLSAAAFQGLTGSVTFAIDENPAGTGGNLRINDFVVNGTVVPEPGSAMLLGLGGLALVARRRR